MGWVDFQDDSNVQYNTTIEFDNKDIAKQYIEDEITNNYKELTRLR
jgi:hypothetical protein